MVNSRDEEGGGGRLSYARKISTDKPCERGSLKAALIKMMVLKWLAVSQPAATRSTPREALAQEYMETLLWYVDETFIVPQASLDRQSSVRREQC